MVPTIRPATTDDLPAINDIYNHYVLTSTCTYQEAPETMEDRQDWFAKHGPQHPIIVAQLNHQIVGWGSLSAYHPRSAYRWTVENSVYVHPHFQHQGIGAALLAQLIDLSKKAGHHSIVALIDASQTASIALHAKFGFVQVAHLKEVGFKDNRWLDVIDMQLML